MIGSVDVCCDLPGPSLSGPVCAWTPHGFFLRAFPTPYGSCRREARFCHQTIFRGSTPDFTLTLSPEVYSSGDTSPRQQGFEITVFHLLCEMPKVIEPHLPVCLLCRWQLCSNMWSSPTTKLLGPIVVTVLWVGFPGKASDPPHVEFPAIVQCRMHSQ